MQRLVRFTPVGLGLLTALLGGCPQSPRGIPPELQAVLNDIDRFRVGAEEPFQEFAGTPITDPNQLAGCWGTYWEPPSPRGGALIVAQSLRYEAATGELTRFVYQTLPFFPPEVSVLRGTLRAYGETLEFDVAEVFSTLRTGELTVVQFDEPPRYRLTLERGGASGATGILATFAEIDTPRTSAGFADGVRLRHTPFACP